MRKSYHISIYSDGKKVTYATINGKYKGMAKCSPEDTFDIVEGIKIATERAMKKVFPEYRDDYYYPDFKTSEICCHTVCSDRDIDKNLASLVLVFEAIAKAKEMLGID